MRKILVLAAVLGLLVAAGCGGSSSSSSKSSSAPAKETTPPGDIPDTQAFVAYKPPSGGFVVKVPEGWARQTKAGVTTFASNLNSVAVQGTPAKGQITPAQARTTLVPQLAKSVPGFRLVRVDTLPRPAGTALHLVYQSSSTPNQVTGKRTVQTVERYIFFKNGREAILTLTGAKGADNVDPWKTVSSSLRWSA